MKTIIVIETAKELINFACPNRITGDKTPFLGNKVTLVFEHTMSCVKLEGAEGFELGIDITAESILKELARRAHLNVSIT